MKIIGLTGGIGSGKSTVAKKFEELGVPIYIADEASKRILADDLEARQQIIELLGESAYTTDNSNLIIPDKKFIASKVFADKDLLHELNAILHPLVRKDFLLWQSNQSYPYIIYEAAILFESGGEAMCDKVILVTAKESDRIARVMKRDQVSQEEVRQRLHHQWTDHQRLEKSDFVIINEDYQQISVFVDNIHAFMLKEEL